MMIKRLLALLLMFASQAFAQPLDPCTGQPANMNNAWPYLDMSADNPPECTPIQSATSTGAQMRWNTAGAFVYNYCKVGPVWRVQRYAATWDYLSGVNLASNMRAALAAPDPLTAFQQLVIANLKTPMDDPSLTPVWCPYVSEMRAAMPKPDATPTPLPTYTYQVKANGATASRPAYAMTNGVRGTKEVARATVGQDCKSTPAAGDQWSEFGPAFAPGVVALCGKKP